MSDHDSAIPAEDNDRAAILSRRTFLIEAALVNAGLAAGCAPKAAPESGKPDPVSTGDVPASSADVSEPQPCLKVAVPDRPDAGPKDAPKPAPQPCLEIAPKPDPQPCLKVAPKRPKVCLKIAPKRPEPRICLSPPVDPKTGKKI